MDFWRRAARTSRPWKIKKWSHPINNAGHTNNSVKTGKKMMKWYGHVVCMVENRRPTQILIMSPEGRRRGRRSEVGRKLRRPRSRGIEQPTDAVNRQLWRLKTSNRIDYFLLVKYIFGIWHGHWQTKPYTVKPALNGPFIKRNLS